MSLDEATTKRLDALSLKWANGTQFRDVLTEAYLQGYSDGCDDGFEARE